MEVAAKRTTPRGPRRALSDVQSDSRPRTNRTQRRSPRAALRFSNLIVLDLSTDLAREVEVVCCDAGIAALWDYCDDGEHRLLVPSCLEEAIRAASAIWALGGAKVFRRCLEECLPVAWAKCA